jgi:redox-sensitive bicupin YhaK (pirin superfamily)
MKTKTQITRSKERFHTEISWLDSRHSFSFGQHYNPEMMGFGPLRVVNDDWIAPNGGFPTHPHRDMEIVSIVLAGELAHKDSMGNGRTIKVGEIQYMSAGTGVQHSEFNPSATEPVHLMQIWIQPNAQGLEPAYADQPLVGVQDDVWSLVLSPEGRNGSMAIRQDAEMRTVKLTPGASITYVPKQEGRGLWVFVITGQVESADATLSEGDSLAVVDARELQLKNVGSEAASVLVFDLPMG